MGAGSIVKFFIEGVATTLLGIFGISGNLVSIVVLSSTEMDMKPSFRHLLKMLAAFDAIFLVFTLTLFGISPWSDEYDQFIKPYLIPYLLPIIQVCTCRNTVLEQQKFQIVLLFCVIPINFAMFGMTKKSQSR